jgi:hypothetical protein
VDEVGPTHARKQSTLSQAIQRMVAVSLEEKGKVIMTKNRKKLPNFNAQKKRKIIFETINIVISNELKSTTNIVDCTPLTESWIRCLASPSCTPTSSMLLASLSELERIGSQSMHSTPGIRHGRCEMGTLQSQPHVLEEKWR